ncbi:MAG: serine hydroxymethyltransferase, partial [Bacteroidota bacterium]
HKTLRGPRGGIIMMGKDFDNPWGRTTKKGTVIKMSRILNGAVFPGMQGGPLEHVIAAKAVAFGECLQPEWNDYGRQVIANAQAMAEELVARGYHIISGGTDNHSMLIDLSNKGVSGRDAERALEKADITLNKNMVPFDEKSAMVTSGIRIGTAAVTTRGFTEADCKRTVAWMDAIISDIENDSILQKVKTEVNAFMAGFPLYEEVLA